MKHYYFLVNLGNHFVAEERIKMVTCDTYYDVDDLQQGREVLKLFPVGIQLHWGGLWYRSADQLTELLMPGPNERSSIDSLPHVIQQAIDLVSDIESRHLLAKWVVHGYLLGRLEYPPIEQELEAAVNLLAQVSSWQDRRDDIVQRSASKEKEKQAIVQSNATETRRLKAQLATLRVQLAVLSMSDGPYGSIQSEINRIVGKLQSLDDRLQAIGTTVSTLSNELQEHDRQGEELGYDRYAPQVNDLHSKIVNAFW